MKLETIKKIWSEINRDVFAAKGMPLSNVPHYLTRNTDMWAAWCEDHFVWNYRLKGVDIRSLIFHEMVHQWQSEYLPPVFFTDYINPHDVYFFGWSGTALRLGFKLEEMM